MSRAADTLQTHAEVAKLAQLLDHEPAKLEFLERLSLEDVRSLRERITEALFDAQDASLRRLAVASKLLPPAVSASIGERAFGPLLSARLAGLLEPSKAVDMAGRMQPPFLADVAVALDPRRARDVISRIPADQIAAITHELVAREEYVTMGRFVGYLSDGTILAALEQMDDKALVQVAFVLEDKSTVSELVGLLPKSRLAGIVRAAADNDLWVQALDLLGHTTERQRKEIVAATAELDHAALEALVSAVIQYDLWQEVLAIAEQDATLQRKLAERVRSLPAPRRRELAAEAAAAGSIKRLGVLGEALAGRRSKAGSRASSGP
ncbi:MAG: hypothetical protein WAK93_05585 [Solirubrobacteraceae bacterium]